MCQHGDPADPYADLGDLADLVGAVERFVARTHAPDRTLDEAQQDLIRQCRLMDLLRLNIAREAAAIDDALRATDDAHTSLIPFLTHDCRMAAGEASNALCVGQQLDTLERSVEAVHEGGIGFAHLALMAHTK
ncbi:MAG TPA: hypothetical protein VFO60_05395, partial [Candidatus Dormibacteraeota bacterium]|nr:hypothetical protein [Candidatus Dormibacteraeota bacterium]